MTSTYSCATYKASAIILLIRLMWKKNFDFKVYFSSNQFIRPSKVKRWVAQNITRILEKYRFYNPFRRSGTSQEVKIRHLVIKQIRFPQLFIRIQKSDFLKLTKINSLRVHFPIQPILIQIDILGVVSVLIRYLIAKIKKIKMVESK